MDTSDDMYFMLVCEHHSHIQKSHIQIYTHLIQGQTDPVREHTHANTHTHNGRYTHAYETSTLRTKTHRQHRHRVVESVQHLHNADTV